MHSLNLAKLLAIKQLAMACIKDGTEHSASINAKFMASQMKSLKLNAMCDDNVDAEGITPDSASRLKLMA